MTSRPVDDRKNHATITTRTTIGQIISALDDRNLSRALRLLEPTSESSGLSPDPDRQEGSHCVKCVTRGE